MKLQKLLFALTGAVAISASAQGLFDDIKKNFEIF